MRRAIREHSRLHSHRRPRRAGDRDDQRDPGPAAGQLPVLAPNPGPEPLRAEGRVQLVPGRDARQGQTVTSPGSRSGASGREPRERGSGRDHEHRPQVRASHPQRCLALLRPRTGLQDMTIEIDPGQKGQEVQEGSTIPLANTEPNVNPDQILASLDGDTQSFLQLLLQGGAQGLYGHSEQLSAGLRRFDPTVRDIARINSALVEAASEPAPRDHQLRQAQHRARPPRHAAGAVRALFEHRAGLVREGTERDPGDAPGIPADASADAEHSHQRQPFADSRARVAQADSVRAGACAGPAAGPAALPGDHDPDQDPDSTLRPRLAEAAQAHQPGIAAACRRRRPSPRDSTI